MTAVVTAGAVSHAAPEWHSLNWVNLHRNVSRLQARIVKAVQAGRWGKVKALQHLLTHSAASPKGAIERLERLTVKVVRAVLRGLGGSNLVRLPDTHYWGKSRRGKWIIKQKTARERLSRGLKRIAEWCRRHRHLPVADQHRELCQKIRGHYAYYGITGNGLWLKKFNQEVRRIWQKWLHRRSRTPSDMPWDRFVRLMERYRFPPIKVVHSVYAAKP